MLMLFCFFFFFFLYSTDGHVCLGAFEDTWNASMNLIAVVRTVLQVLSNPDEHAGVNKAACALMNKDMAAFEKKARDMTKKYAMDDEDDE